jgi:integrase
VQVRNVLRQVFSYTVFQELVPANPCQFVEAPKFQARERVLSEDELRTVWRALENSDAVKGLHLSPEVAIALKLCLVTLQRRGEVAGLHTREIDRDARSWTIPGSRTKNHRTHVVPLSGPALSLINEAVALRAEGYTGYLFPSPKEPDKPITSPALSKAMRRLAKAVGLQDVRSHDMRRTGATVMTSERCGVSRFIVSQVLNHASDTDGSAAVTAVYDRASYLPQKRRALEGWAKELDRIVSSRPEAAKVVQISKQRAIR